MNLPAELEYIEPGPEAISVGKAGERPANIARYLMAQGAGSARLSPKSDQIAFISDITGKRQLWVMPVEGGQAKQLTFGNGVTFFEWRPENQDAISNADQSLIYGADNNRDEQESYFLIHADGQLEAEILSASQGGFRVFGGFNADGSELSYASTERNGLDFDIYVKSLSVGSDSEPRRVFEGQYGNFVEAISPDGNTLILSSSVGKDSDNLYALNVQTGVRTVLSQPSPRANHTDAGVMFLDESTLLFATNKGREFMALTMLSLTTGEEKTLFESDADVDNVMLCGPNKKQIVFTSNHDGFSQLRVFKKGRVAPVSGLPEGVYSIDCAASNTLLLRVSAFDRPGDLFTYDLKNTSFKSVFKSNLAGIDPDSLVRPESVKFLARDGVELQGLLYLPQNIRDPKPPIAFLVHGGPTAQSRPSYNGPLQYLLGRGIAVFQPNVRGSTGFGRTYTTLDDRENLLESIADLNDMLNYLETEGRVDTERAAVIGGSYGGYAVSHTNRA